MQRPLATYMTINRTVHSRRDGVIPDAPVRSVSFAADKNYIQPVTLTTR